MMSHHPLAFEMFTEIGIISQLSNAMLANALPKGMTQAQFNILNHFVRLGINEASPANLASAFQVTRPTITSTLTRMERAGLVRIRPDLTDGRAKLVSITANGHKVRLRCLKSVEKLIPLIATAVSDEVISSVLPGLRKIRIELDKMRD
jgi:DNA-binding MarR family transcriptional regulator